MNTQTKPKDAWLYAYQLVENCLPYLPPRGILTAGLPRGVSTVGSFVYDDGNPDFYFFRQGTNGEGIKSLVGFSIDGPRKPENFYRLLYCEEGNSYGLFNNGVQYLGRGDVYPCFSYFWLRGGNLNFLTARPSAGISAVYELKSNWRLDYRQLELPPEVPELITEDTNKLLGVPIPWKIDYDKVSWEILSKSGLEEFVKEVKERKST